MPTCSTTASWQRLNQRIVLVKPNPSFAIYNGLKRIDSRTLFTMLTLIWRGCPINHCPKDDHVINTPLGWGSSKSSRVRWPIELCKITLVRQWQDQRTLIMCGPFLIAVKIIPDSYIKRPFSYSWGRNMEAFDEFNIYIPFYLCNYRPVRNIVL